MHVTWLDSNSWLWEIGGQRVLVDPWLVGPLVFGQAKWLFCGEHPTPRSLPDSVDLILLSQGLPDHAHTPTLQALSKSIPVIGSPSAAQVARDLGFTHVTALAHGEVQTHGSLTIKAVPGAPLGPFQREHGYVLTEQATGLKLFYEPHGFHDESLRQEGPVDVVITPMVDLALPLVGPIIRGCRSAQELAEWLTPQVMLPTAEGGEATYDGVLLSVLSVKGSPDAVRRSLDQTDHRVQVLTPEVGTPIELALKPFATSG